MNRNTLNNNGCINSNLRSDLMRKSMETKNLLNSKGAIYVGKGSEVSIPVKDTSVQSISLSTTGSLPAGVDNTVLTCQSNANLGLTYKKISPEQLENYSGVWPMKVANANSADDASLTESSNYAIYTSINNEKTISDRLTNLNRKDLPFIGNAIFTPNSVIASYYIRNSYKEGKYANLNLSFDFWSASEDQTDRKNFYAGKNTATSSYKLPKEFCPKTEQKFYILSSKIVYKYEARDPDSPFSPWKSASIAMENPLVLIIGTDGSATIQAYEVSEGDLGPQTIDTNTKKISIRTVSQSSFSLKISYETEVVINNE